jgi:hypothetical protein
MGRKFGMPCVGHGCVAAAQQDLGILVMTSRCRFLLACLSVRCLVRPMSGRAWGKDS